MAVIVLLGFGVAAVAAEPEDGDEPKTGLWSWTGSKTGNEHWVHVPDDYDPAVPCPIMVMSHGINSSGKGMISGGTCRGAVQRGWIAVAPTWNWDGNSDDSGAVAEELIELVKLLDRRYAIDRRTIVSSGYSGGGGVSIRSFTRYPRVYSHLVSQSSNFYGQYVMQPVDRSAGTDRPVLVLWGEKDHPLILEQGPREATHFRRKRHPTADYVVPGHPHRPEPKQVWGWLDATLLDGRIDALEKAVRFASTHRRPEHQPAVAEALAPVVAREEDFRERSVADGLDPFVRKCNERYNKLSERARSLAEEAREAHDEAVAEGRRRLDEQRKQFSEENKARNIRWVRRFCQRWAAVPLLLDEARAAYTDAYGESFPETESPGPTRAN